MSNKELFEAAQGALKDIADEINGVSMGAPPGAEPLPYKEQVAQFVADVPDLLTKGPRYQEIEAKYGPGAADAYVADMVSKLWQPRQRRSPL